SGQLAEACLAGLRAELSSSQGKIRHCVDQLDDEQLWWRPAESMNSIANILLHLCGNVTQWIISGVGGAADHRDRPREFSEQGPIAKEDLLRRFDEVVARAQETLDGVAPNDFLEARRIQGFDETVLSAIVGCVCHFCGHAQQVVYITRLTLGDRYRFEWSPSTPEEGAPGP
ncbi:MAG: DUF1572 family protein, partial [Planctomycetota bacterium]